uniref:Amino acid transporter transmembrane domain-containing protein n=1 Tax=Kalanchoe fedtschenkoi TaxID=63787 RepID=A0A7N0UME0_KALFE
MATDELKTPLTTGTGAVPGSSFIKACFNGINAFLGIGLLTVPYALSSGGWLSLLLFLLIGLISFYTGILLKRCMDSSPYAKTYLNIAEQAYGKNGRITVSIIINSELYLVTVGLLILEADNLHKLFPNFSIHLLAMDGSRSFLILTAMLILPSMLFTDLSLLSYVSATGVASCLVIFGSIFSVGAFGGVGFGYRGQELVNLGGLSTAISLYIVCFAGHPVIPSIYTSMKSQFHFTKVLLVSFFITILTYMATAIVAYLMYGANVESSITLNLPSNQVAGAIAIYTTLLIPITRYALMMSPVATSIEGALPQEYTNSTHVRILIRIALLISTVMVAYVFPYYETLMAIIGSIFVVLGSFIIPCLCYLKISRFRRRWGYETTAIILILIFSATAAIIGTYSSILELFSSIASLVYATARREKHVA